MDPKKAAERQILKAQAEGKLKNLKGEGKPLAAQSGGADAVGYRIMAEAGALPAEIIIRREIAALKAELASASDPTLRKKLMAGLADLEMRYAIAKEARIKFTKD